MAELAYATENGGRMFLRDNSHPGTVNRLTKLNARYFATPLPKYANANVWFCPNAMRTLTGNPLVEVDREESMATHIAGYGFYNAWWDGTRARTFGEPWWGPIGKRIKPNATRLTQLRPETVRASEWYEPTVPMGGTGGSGAFMPNHADRRGNLAGGNMLMGDGSVRWSTYGQRYLAVDLYIYVMPEELRNSP